MEFDYRQPLSASTDTLTVNCFGPDVIKVYINAPDSCQSGIVVYRISTIEILIWRDRGLHTIHLSKIGAAIKHSIFTLANYLGNNIGDYTATEKVEEVESQLKFIRVNLKDIDRVLSLDNVNELLDYDAEFKGINFGVSG